LLSLALLLAKAAVGVAKRAAAITGRMSRLIMFFFVSRLLSLSRETKFRQAFFMMDSFSLTADLIWHR
jgi:hypothetical protein